MKLVVDPEEISFLFQKVKAPGKVFVTNYYIDTDKLNDWVKKAVLYYVEAENAVIFFRKNQGFDNLYYAASCMDQLQGLLKEYLIEAKLVVDIIGAPGKVLDLISIFKNSGFQNYAELHRYTRFNKLGENEFAEFSSEVLLAEGGDAAAISQLFEENFEKVADQVPDLEEISALINNKKVLVIKEGGLIKGFLVRTFQGKYTILNNFLVQKKFRGQKVGSRLLKHYFFESRDKLRMVLWVVSDNLGAQGIYKRFGYEKDGVEDIILMKQK